MKNRILGRWSFVRLGILIVSGLLSAHGVSAQNATSMAAAESVAGVGMPDADELRILASEDKVPDGSNDSYMRISIDRKVEADKWTLIVHPALLDGYYFGRDAERYKVTEYDLTTTPITIKRQEMADLDDFQPNQMYLIRSKADINNIVSLSPGVKTKVPATPSGVTLMCLTLDVEPTAVEKVEGLGIRVEGSSPVYDLSGRLSKSVRSGIYIINGKKVFEK